MMSAHADLSSDVEQGKADLPKGWEWKRLGDVSRTTSGGTPSRKVAEYFEGDIPWVKSGELPDGNVTEIAEYITEEAVKNSSAKLFPAGTLLIALYGATVGKLGVLTKDATTNQAVCAVFPHNGLNPMYLFWYLRYARSELIGQAVGGAQPNISQGILRDLQIPIAPYEQQGRIAAEIEKQFSRLDEAGANLKRVKANLKCYKAAVLKAAVEGKLTEEWRKAHPDTESASKLLNRILAERRAKWEEAELAKMAAKGKAPKNDKWKAKYKEPSPPDTVDLPGLPEGWVYATAEQLTDETRAITYGVIKLGEPVDGGIPVLRSSDVRQLRIDLENVKCISPEIAGNYTRTFLRGGEVLMTVRGTLGGVAVVPPQCHGFNVSREVAMMALVGTTVPQLIALFIASVPLENWLMRRAKGIAYTGINIETLKALPIPIPPIKEQHRIVEDIARHLSLIRETEAQVDANFQRAVRLRQSILSAAFSGGFCSRRENATVKETHVYG